MKWRVLREYYVVNTLFELLTEPRPIRLFAVRVISDLMVLPDSSAKSIDPIPDSMALLPNPPVSALFRSGPKGAEPRSANTEMWKMFDELPLDSRCGNKLRLMAKFIEFIPRIANHFDLALGFLQCIRRTVIAAGIFSYAGGGDSKNPFLSRASSVFDDADMDAVVASENTRTGDRHVMLSRLLSLPELQKTQNEFRDRGAFMQVLTLLNAADRFFGRQGDDTAETTDKPAAVLCLAVIRTLTALMVGNTANKQFVRDTIGYDQLRALILRIEHKQPSATLFAALLDMLVDGSFDVEERYIMENPEVVLLVMALAPFAASDVRLRVIESVLSMLTKSTLNLSCACEVGLADVVLDVFPLVSEEVVQQQLIQVLQTLGTHSLTVKQLKRFFGLMKVDPKDSSRPHYNPWLLDALQNMKCKDRPANFFYFDGSHSGLALPPIEYFPNTRGYTFSTWLRIESYDHPHPDQVPRRHYQPRLFCFSSRDGSGVQAFFNNKRLTVEVTLSPGKVFVESLDFVLKPRIKFYHLVITHQVAPTFGQPELKIYVDTYLRLTKPMKYPNFKGKVLSHSFIGTDQAFPKPRAFFGQMSTIYLFDDVLSQQQVESMYWLESSYSSTFAPSELSQHGASCALILNGSLTAHILFCYSSKAGDAVLFFDNTPEGNPRLGAALCSNYFHHLFNQASSVSLSQVGYSIVHPKFYCGWWTYLKHL
jgi:hypothetical protein